MTTKCVPAWTVALAPVEYLNVVVLPDGRAVHPLTPVWVKR